MCGITGAWLPEGLPEAVLEKTLETMRHRGPDDIGIHENGTLSIGMCRLSIIDLAGGNQPIFNEDQSISVVFNGEVYNYRELIPPLQRQNHTFRTQSDTEVLVHLYETYGQDMCQHLRGMYAFAIWDSRQKLLYIARDRFGKKPLYYMRTRSGGLLFASELKALRCLAHAAGETLTIRDQAIYDYLSLGSVPQPNTVFKDVFALPPGSWMQFDGHDLQIHRYWQLDYHPIQERPYAEALEEIRSLISEAVRIRLRSDVPIGVLLSSGIDSSVIAYEAAKHLGGSLHTFTVKMDSAEFDEAPTAVRTAQALGVENVILPMKISPLESLQYLVRQYDQPYADPSAIPSVAVSRLARQHVKVALNGDGGDEIFVGYRRHIAADQIDSFRWIPAPIARTLAHSLSSMTGKRRSKIGLGARFLRALHGSPGERYLIRTGDMLREVDKQQIWTRAPMQPTEKWIESLLPDNAPELIRQLRGDIQIQFLSTLLVKMDIATMSASLEARSPLMDHPVAEFAATLPPHYHLRGSRTKALLRDAYRGLVPDEVLNGTKRGFEIPLVDWLREDLRPILIDTLGDKSARVYTYIHYDYARDLLDEKIMQDRNWGYLVYSLLMLELWLRESENGQAKPA